MLIGQFCETYPPTLDGVGRVMLNYCQAQRRLGHNSVYIAPKNPLYPEHVPCPTLLYRSVAIPKQSYHIGLPLADGHYRRRIAKLPFDIVHTHSPFIIGHEARRLSLMRHVPLVSTFHSKYYDDVYMATNSRALARACVRSIVAFYKTCDEVWAVNSLTADVLRGYGYRGEIVIMPNGTDRETITDEDRKKCSVKYPLREGVPTLMFAGQLDLKKNIMSTVAACEKLRDEGFDFQMLMVGDGPNAKLIKQRVLSAGMGDRFTFTGFMGDRHMMLALYERADLFVFPSLYDNAPMVVREAASMGTPSLLIRGSCSSEGITHDSNGFLCYNTVDDIAGCIKRSLPLTREVGRRAAASIPIPWDTLMTDVIARYQALVKKKKSERFLFRQAHTTPDKDSRSRE